MGTERKVIKMELINDFDVFPFTQIIWNDPDAEDEWGLTVNRARSLHNELEYEMVKHGHRRCATVHIMPRNYDVVIERIMLDGLVWLPIQRSKSYSGFSHRHFPVNELDSGSTVYGVLARNKDDAEAFRAASACKPVDHRKIGELLGFPECCTEYFNNTFGQIYDPVFQTAENSPHETINDTTLVVDMHIATQQMLRYVGFRLTSHFPCSLDCKASIEVGKVWYNLAKEVDPKGLDALEKILLLPGRWSVLHGVAVVTTEPFTVLSNSMPTRQRWDVVWNKVGTY